jgi:hypothetical protein
MRLLILALLLSACAKDATAPSPSLTESVLVGPLLIHVGDTVNVSVALFNAGDQPQPYESAFCGQPFHVFDASGLQVDASSPCLDISKPVILQPGDQYVYQGRWVADSAVGLLDGSPRTPLAVGVYTIRGEIAGFLGAPVQNRATTVQVTK